MLGPVATAGFTTMTLRHASSAILLLALAACASPSPLPSGAPATNGQATCDAGAAQWAIGKPATTDTIERVRVDSHSSVVRVLHPGQIITMEFSAERVDIRVDGNNVILAVTCG
jgi:hypothetical protein